MSDSVRRRGNRQRRPASGRDLLNVASVRPAWRYVGKCDTCGKNRFVTRAMARAAARDLHPGDPMSVYRCGNYFHYGHNSHKYTREIGVGLRRCSDTERHKAHRWGDENETTWHCKGEGTNGRTGDGDGADQTEQGTG